MGICKKAKTVCIITGNLDKQEDVSYVIASLKEENNLKEVITVNYDSDYIPILENNLDSIGAAVLFFTRASNTNIDAVQILNVMIQKNKPLLFIAEDEESFKKLESLNVINSNIILLEDISEVKANKFYKRISNYIDTRYMFTIIKELDESSPLSIASKRTIELALLFAEIIQKAVDLIHNNELETAIKELENVLEIIDKEQNDIIAVMDGEVYFASDLFDTTIKLSKRLISVCKIKWRSRIPFIYAKDFLHEIEVLLKEQR